MTWLSLVVNILLSGFKLAAGLIGRSGAMVADAVHSVSDLATDVVVLAGLRFSSRPVDRNHSYGHGKLETVAAALIGATLLVVAAGLARGAVMKLHDCMEGRLPEVPTGIALVAAGVSIVVKELLYRCTVKTGKRIGSGALVANAWHHRSDALSSVGALLGIGGAMLLGGKWSVLDPLAALVVCFFIGKAGVEVLSGSLGELTESSLGEGMEGEILRIVRSVPGAVDPHNLRTRRIGRDVAVDLHVRAEGRMSLTEAHDIASVIEERIRERFGRNTFVSIHVEPVKSAPDRS